MIVDKQLAISALQHLINRHKKILDNLNKLESLTVEQSKLLHNSIEALNIYQNCQIQ